MIPRWLPNALSVLRIALVPVWLALALVGRAEALAEGRTVARWPLVAVLVILGATDMLDGFLARRFKLATNLGATLDAVADKLATAVGVTVLVFVTPPGCTALPSWLWGVLVTRDLVLGVGWLVIWKKHRAVAVEHRWHGRLSTLLLFFTVVAACGGAPALAIVIASAVGALLVVPGTVDYVREGWRQLHAAPAGSEG